MNEYPCWNTSDQSKEQEVTSRHLTDLNNKNINVPLQDDFHYVDYLIYIFVPA